MIYQICEVFDHAPMLEVCGFRTNDITTCEVWLTHLQCDHPTRQYAILVIK